MYMIAGLGNPGEKYENTRHNVGWHVIDRLSEKWNIPVTERKHLGISGRGSIQGERVLLLRPLTYMNNSGQSIRAAADYYKIPPENIIVVSDDINLPAGQLRIRLKGSAGGHNGLKSVIAHLGSENFPRVRLGIGGKPEGWDLADYVLGRPAGEDREAMESAYREAADAVELMLFEGGTAAMNRYNRKPNRHPDGSDQTEERRKKDLEEQIPKSAGGPGAVSGAQ